MTWAELSDLLPWLDWGLVLTYMRLQGFVLALPAIGERTIPARVKVALAMAMAPLFSSMAASSIAPVSAFALMTAAGAELLVGLLCGGLLRLMTLIIDVATSAIAATASLSQIVGVPNEYSPHPIGNLLHLGGIAILMALGLPVMFADLIADSLTLWPPGQWPGAALLSVEAVRLVASGFALAMLLAAPFSLGGFLFQALSGVVNRVMPSLPVVFIASPAAILLALVALAMTAPVLISIWAEAVLDFTLPVP